MKITQPRLERNGDRTRTVATISWEDCDRPALDAYFETDAQFADGLSEHPDAFLAAAVLPAMRFGERRIAVEGRYCPFQKAGLETAMALLRSWHGGKRRPVVIEGTPRCKAESFRERRAAFLMSGGIDSLSVLRRNRLNIPPEHPAAIRDGILIFGLEITDPAVFPHVQTSMSTVANAVGVTLVSAATNVRYLVDDWAYWLEEFEAAVLTSVALAFSRRFSTLYVPSPYDFGSLSQPHGSHPLLDPNFSSYELRIHHDAALTRLEKTQIVADWPEGLHNLRVCNHSDLYRSGILNCGRCEKCLRTLTTLLILGKLDEATTFAEREVTADRLCQFRLTKTDYPFWLEMLEPLAATGRNDLVLAIQGRIKAMRGAQATGWRRAIRNFDQRFLGSSLARMVGRLNRKSPAHVRS